MLGPSGRHRWRDRRCFSRSLCWRGRPKAPEGVQLTGTAIEVTPQGKPLQAAVVGRALPPWPHGICGDWDETGRRVGAGLLRRPAPAISTMAGAACRAKDAVPELIESP